MITLGLGIFFRIYGINWDEEFHLHPDERFLTMVISSITPVSSLNEYFNTDISRLNPHNILDFNNNSVFPFFVYGTLPLFLVRYVAELLGQTGYSEIHIVGRYLSGIFDAGTIILVFMIAQDLFKKKGLSLIASFLYACCVLPIQISHFFIVDNFTTFFATATLYAAVRILNEEESQNDRGDKKDFKIFHSHQFFNYLLFGLSLGLAAASKINAVVLAFLLPLAIIFRDWNKKKTITNFLDKKVIIRIIFTGIVSFFIFRIFQPYAFSGPDFFGLMPNPRWLNNLRELSILSSGESNYPPSLQWARRSIFFPIKNMVVWGMGLPLGIFSFLGFLLIGYRFIKGEYKKYGLLWVFTALYMFWQISLWNPTMRYFLIIYPPKIIMAAWFLYEIFSRGILTSIPEKRLTIKKIIIISSGVILIIGTLIWAVAFMNIYRQPMTRIAASKWIYENIESAINLQIDSQGKQILRPLPIKQFDDLWPGSEIVFPFQPEVKGILKGISVERISSQGDLDEKSSLLIEIIDQLSEEIIYSNLSMNQFAALNDPRGEPFYIDMGDTIFLNPTHEYLLKIRYLEVGNSLRLSGALRIGLDFYQHYYNQTIHHFSKKISNDEPYTASFSPMETGSLMGVELFRVKSKWSNSDTTAISIVVKENNSDNVIGRINQVIDLSNPEDFRGKKITLSFSDPVFLTKNVDYQIEISCNNEGEWIYLNGSKTVKETDWDDALPLFMYGYNPFDLYEGLYPSELNFQIYWDDNTEKFSRFIEALDQADYFFITSNRQWGSTTQIPERYPLTSHFYRELIGCPSDDIQKCYREAVPGKFSENLGFTLVQTFQSNPKIIGLEFNSQYAEEAFTVYDHPKVMIFKKDADFDIKKVAETLSEVDLRTVLNVNPKQAESRPGTLLLGINQFEKQRASGTWSGLFSRSSILNSNPVLSIAFWYLMLSLIGWVFFPVSKIIFRNLPDSGFPIFRAVGLLIFSYIVWLIGSLKIDVTRSIIFSIFLFLFFINFYVFLKNKIEIKEFIKENKKHIIFIEILSLFLFLFFLAIRIGNPDLWHPFKGGEKPMDFAYLNSLIKSINFPPYDPWYAQGYINYYYFGFVLAAIPIKLLGIIPSVGYNLILPTFFSLTGLAVFCLVWNFQKLWFKENEKSHKNFPDKTKIGYIFGLISIFIVLFFGNLGTIRMIIDGFSRISANNLMIEQNQGFGYLSSVISGIKLFISGFNFPYYPGDWYWIPSRVIPGEPITEFPFFTFLYGDPHAHLFAYPFTIIVMVWGVSLLNITKKSNYGWDDIIVFLFGALAIGCLRVTNTWDFPIFLFMALAALIFSNIRWTRSNNNLILTHKHYLSIFLQSILFIFLSFFLYYPFSRWYGQAYTMFLIWGGDKTPLWAYISHWGFFIFILGIFLFSQFIQLLGRTPLSVLKPYYRYKSIFLMILFACCGLLTYLLFLGYQTIIIVFPAITLCMVLFLFGSESLYEKVVYILISLGLALTLFVELFVLQGDIGRMNTVFKFYLQAWTLLSISTALVFPNVLKTIIAVKVKTRRIVLLSFLGILVISVSLFPLLAGIDKMNDRIADHVPLTIDGMEFMKYASVTENEMAMDLNNDYHAIKWVQENIIGTPVIVEAHIPEYRWGSRFSIYTGLPTVLGWNWHQRQQRAINPAEWVFNRASDISEFYSTEDIGKAIRFLDRYQVGYIILGQLEKATYPREGLAKFDEFDGVYWNSVYSSDEVKIFRVNEK